jgi:hypothetical protein
VLLGDPSEDPPPTVGKPLSPDVAARASVGAYEAPEATTDKISLVWNFELSQSPHFSHSGLVALEAEM